MSLALQMTPKVSCRLTWELCQSLDVLAMGAGRLRSYIVRQSRDNPFLRVEDVDSCPQGPESLEECLGRQIRMALNSPSERRIAYALVEMIDEAGYLPIEAADIAARMGWDRDCLDRVLGAMRYFEPTGIGARNLADCLKRQLEEQGKWDRVTATLVDHLPLAGEKRWARLAELAGCDQARIRKGMETLRRLDPKPGARFHVTPSIPRFADLTLTFRDDGQWCLAIGAKAVPRVAVDRDGADRSSRIEDPSWKRGKIRQADQLVRSMERRSDTLLRIAHGIMGEQASFFHHGLKALRPLSARRIARMTSCHPSTVGRTIRDKHIATPKGVLPLTFFFDSPAYPGAAHTSGYVRDRIRRVIEAEDRPLSDRMIAERLDSMGFPLGRRTIGRYRRKMNISAGRQRGFGPRAGGFWGEDGGGAMRGEQV